MFLSRTENSVIVSCDTCDCLIKFPCNDVVKHRRVLEANHGWEWKRDSEGITVYNCVDCKEKKQSNKTERKQ